MIASGHDPDRVWDMTPLQMQAWVSLARRRRLRDAAIGLVAGTLAARGDPKEIERKIHDWE